MNIFYLSNDPAEAAHWMVDKHVVKMILETAQLLSTAHRLLDGEKIGKKYVLHDMRENIIYKATHINHPSAIWARQSVENYNWLYDHLYALGEEYKYRYGKTHKVFRYDGNVSIAYMISSPPYNLREFDWTTPPSAMDKKYIVSDDPIQNYRNYYKLGKSHIHTWKNRQPPEWIT